jgi:phosphohistidine phosphatase
LLPGRGKSLRRARANAQALAVASIAAAAAACFAARVHIHLLRHGIAEDAAPSGADADRALTDEGRKRLRKAADAWRAVVEPLDLVLTSPLLRARQTCEIFCAAVGFTGEVRVCPELVPSAAPSLALQLFEGEALSGANAIAAVGHEPHLGYLLGLLLTGQGRLPVPFKKGMLVGVETASRASLVGQLRFALTQKLAGELG